jgi:hypothetical protein
MALLQAVSLDAETAEKLRAEMESKRSSSGKGGKGRGPVDSGKGVRIQVSLQRKWTQQQQAATTPGTNPTAANVAVIMWMI